MKLPELCQAVTDSILLQIEPLSQDRAIIDLLAVSVERNVTTLVHIIGYQWCFQELAAVFAFDRGSRDCERDCASYCGTIRFCPATNG